MFHLCVLNVDGMIVFNLYIRLPSRISFLFKPLIIIPGAYKFNLLQHFLSVRFVVLQYVTVTVGIHLFVTFADRNLRLKEIYCAWPSK